MGLKKWNCTGFKKGRLPIICSWIIWDKFDLTDSLKISNNFANYFAPALSDWRLKETYGVSPFASAKYLVLSCGHMEHATKSALDHSQKKAKDKWQTAWTSKPTTGTRQHSLKRPVNNVCAWHLAGFERSVPWLRPAPWMHHLLCYHAKNDYGH